MATKANDKRTARQGSVSNSDYGGYSVPVSNGVSDSSGQESSMGFLVGLVVMCFVFVIILPVMGMMYMDILEAKHETQHQQKQVQKLIDQAKEK